MRNKLGDDGVINIDGKIGSVAESLDISDPEFFDSIETGIKSTVRVLINNGFKTYSSCQGHYDASFSLRNVVVVLHSIVSGQKASSPRRAAAFGNSRENIAPAAAGLCEHANPLASYSPL